MPSALSALPAALPNTAPGQPASGAPRPASNDFYAQGQYGQYTDIAPDSTTVVVRLGTATGSFNWPAWLAELARRNP